MSLDFIHNETFGWNDTTRSIKERNRLVVNGVLALKFSTFYMWMNSEGYLDAYITNVIKQIKKGYVFSDTIPLENIYDWYKLVTKHDISKLIAISFDWRYVDEGQNYWVTASAEWMKYYKTVEG